MGEPFPPADSSAAVAMGTSTAQSTSTTTRRRRRTSSSLGADPRGDTGAGAIATNLPRVQDSPGTAADSKKGTRERKRTKAKKMFRRWKRMSLKHTWVNPLILIVVLLAAYFVSPGEHNPLHYAIFLSYANPPLNERTDTLPAHIGDVTQYGKGPKDFAFVAFYTLVFTFTREFLMQRLIRPLALYFGITNRGKQSRFMEQTYTAIYFAVFGPFGLWVMSRTPVWYFNITGMYEGFPHRAHDLYFKAFYLLEAAYWAQQMIVLMLQLEAPRKDFKELVLHHIVTLALIGLSYRFHFTYMGIAVYITHDVSDFFLAVSTSHFLQPPPLSH
jgi:very-long-chain ceramide synthase